ncbi:MAG: universal stress protein [Thermoplasmatota archaeon]
MAPVRVLFPLDGSEPAYEAMAKALRVIPADAEIEATVLVVMQEFKGASEDMVRRFEEDTDDEVFPTTDSAAQVFHELRRRVGALAPQVRFKVAKGNVRREILGEAANHDLLVMHATSRGGSLARGSHRLARKAPCDVLLIRP